MPKITIVSLVLGGLASALIGTVALTAPHQSPVAGVARHVDPKTKAWFDRAIEHMLDESSSVADARPPSG